MIVVECDASESTLAAVIGCDVGELVLGTPKVRSVLMLAGHVGSAVELDDDVPRAMVEDLGHELVSRGYQVSVWSVGLTASGEREWPGTQW